MSLHTPQVDLIISELQSFKELFNGQVEDQRLENRDFMLCKENHFYFHFETFSNTFLSKTFY